MSGAYDIVTIGGRIFLVYTDGDSDVILEQVASDGTITSIGTIRGVPPVPPAPASPGPTLSSLSVATGTGAGTTPVTLTGTDFTADMTVTFGGTTATSIVYVGTTSMTCVAPVHTSGVVSVSVTNTGGVSTLSDSFTYTAGRTVTAVSPDTDIPAGLATVTISGTGFTLATNATIGGTSIGSFAVTNDTTITGTVPAQATLGTYDVVVSGGGMDTITLSSAFTYKQWKGVNHNIYSQSTWTSGAPNAGTNYQKSDHRTIDYFYGKGMNHIRLMFTWEWLQDTLSATIPGSGAFLTYWNNFVDTVNYATGLGMTVLIGHYGYTADYWAVGSGNTTPTWKGVGDGAQGFTNVVGGATVTNTHFSNLWTQLATYFLSNERVSFGLINEPHDMNTATWFATAQAAITAIRATGNTAWIHVPGQGYAGYEVDNTYYDTATTKRATSYGWANANGTGSPLTDPLGKILLEVHMYMDDTGGSTLNIDGYSGGTSAHAAMDRLDVAVTWARALGYKVHVGEIGFYASTTGAQDTWDFFANYCDNNADVVTGYDWWAASDIGWWTDTGTTHFSISPTTSGTPYTGDTVNMTMIAASLTGLTAAPAVSDTYPSNPASFTADSRQAYNDGTTDYWAMVPASYDATHNTPFKLFVWLHGCGGYGLYDVVTTAYLNSSQGFITMAPGGREGACWSSYATDGAKILSMIADIKTRYNIDASQVFIGGYSSGGDIGYPILFKNASLFAGGLFVNTQPSTSAVTDAASAAWAVNVAHLAHLSDSTYPIATVRTRMASLVSAGIPVLTGAAIELAGTHYDTYAGDSQQDRTVAGTTTYDIITYLLPYIDSEGWTAP